MQLIPLGLVTVATAGTTVPLTGDSVVSAWKVRSIIIQPLDSNTGKLYFGKNALYTNSGGLVTVTMLGSTGAGVIKTFLPPTTSGLNDWFFLPAPDGAAANLYLVSEFRLDASVNAQSAHVTLALG